MEEKIQTMIQTNQFGFFFLTVKSGKNTTFEPSQRIVSGFRAIL